MRILIFGGTFEARELANQLVGLGHDVTTSLAGRTLDPLLPQGDIRSGGFGGITRLSSYFEAQGFQYIVDATHPYADAISEQLPIAAEAANLDFLRLQRPEWLPPQGATWLPFASIADALKNIPHQARVLLTTGHEALALLETRPTCHFIVRLIEPPKAPLPPNASLLLSRPPYYLDAEIDLMRAHRISLLLTKNAGGDQTYAKIQAAAQLDLPTYMITRAHPPKSEDAQTVQDVIARIQAPVS
jgi:precorrin-6A/cobalt-precorrin-6A reductase